MLVARFIHRHFKPNQLPLTWTFPGSGTFQGAQVLPVEEALYMATTGEHPADDFFTPSKYDYLAILDISGASGERGPLGYRAVTPGDVKAMYVIPYDDASFGWAMTGIALELADEGYDIPFDDLGMPEDEWYEDLMDEVLPRLLEEMTRVTPQYVGG